ncbi:MAG TPA: condensation domain-containing protein, partial [Candidatus Dormibacteraeota bacterium]
PFDLARPPLARLDVIRLAPDDHVVLLTVHHLVADLVSMRILAGELMALYRGELEGVPAMLPHPPLQYADYAIWQRGWLRGRPLERLSEFWRAELEGAPLDLDLPLDRPRPAVRTERGGRAAVEVPPDVAARLRDLARAERATPFMSWLALFAALLHRATGQDDLLIGTPVAGRDRAEVQGVVGLFLNTVVIRSRAGDGGLRDLLRRVRERAVEALGHAEYPFERLVDDLHVSRDPARTPVVQALFVHVQEEGDAPGAEPFSLGLDAAKFDLTLYALERDGRVRLELEHSADVIDPATAEALLAALLRLADEGTAHPDTPVVDLPTESPSPLAGEEAEGRRGAAQTLIEVFTRRAAEHPEATAIESDEARLTYADLDAAARRLAARLAAADVAPGDRVALVLERTAALPVAVVGVAMAGAACLAIDPADPPRRVAALAALASARVLVTTREIEPDLEDLPCPTLLVEDGASAEPAAPAAIEPGAPAWLATCSGPGGATRLASLAHGSWAAQLASLASALGIGSEDAFALVHSPAHDLFPLELWGALLRGARLVIAPYWVSRTPEALLDLVAEERVTVLALAPSELGDGPAPAAAPPLRALLLGGEPVDPGRAHAWARTHAPGAAIAQLCGTAETGAAAAWAPVADGAGGPALAPAGTPGVLVLDRALRPAGTAIAGELCLAASDLDAGYAGEPALTAERYVRDASGRRLLRTGVAARRLASGAVAPAAGGERRLAARGFRIDPAEVEREIVEAAGAAGAALAAGAAGLVAYVEGPGLEASAVRAALADRLPDHALPALVVPVAALPRLRDGSVDLTRLPDPAPEGGARGFVEPRDPVEQALASLWAQLLRVPAVGVHDNFFELGGDSILSIQMVSRAARLGLRITPRQVFQHQTLAELAAVVGQAQPVTAEQGPVTGEAALTPVQRWFFDRAGERPAHWNQGFLLEVPIEVDPSALERAVAALHEHHDALRLRFRKEAGGWRQWHADDVGPGTFAHVPLDGLPLTERGSALEAEAARFQGSLDLANGPLLRIVLFSMGEGRTPRLLLIAHHLVIDAVSWRILLEDLLTAYGQVAQGIPVGLGLKTTSFKEWSERLSAMAAAEETLAALPVWRAVAERGAGGLPVDLDPEAAGPDDARSAASVRVALTEAESDALLHRAARGLHAQPHELLLAALGGALEEWTGRPATLVEVE